MSRVTPGGIGVIVVNSVFAIVVVLAVVADGIIIVGKREVAMMEGFEV